MKLEQSKRMRLIKPPRVDQLRPKFQIEFDPEILLTALMQARYAEIIENREEILAAFIAKHGIDPDDAIQVVSHIDSNTEIFYVTKREQT